MKRATGLSHHGLTAQNQHEDGPARPRGARRRRGNVAGASAQRLVARVGRAAPRSASSFGDSFDTNREQRFPRLAYAELPIEAGAVVTASVCEGLIIGPP